MREHSWQAICFDLDGVLIHTMPDHAAAWLAATRRYGLRVSREEIYAWEGEPGRLTATRLLRRGRGRSGSARQLLREKERLFARRLRRRRIRVAEAWLTLLRRLRRGGLRLALVTGTSWGEVRRALPARVRQAFDVIVTGDRVRRGKPDPEPYRAACRRLGLAPGRVVVVENAPYGITSARRAGVGWILALASALPPRHLRGADRIVRQAGRLRRVLGGLTSLKRPRTMGRA